MHHIPNGGKRGKAEAARLKAMGVKPGVSDIFCRYQSGLKPSIKIQARPKTLLRPVQSS